MLAVILNKEIASDKVCGICAKQLSADDFLLTDMSCITICKVCFFEFAFNLELYYEGYPEELIKTELIRSCSVIFE